MMSFELGCSRTVYCYFLQMLEMPRMPALGGVDTPAPHAIDC